MCIYRFKDGKQCQLDGAEKGLCFWHDPDIDKRGQALGDELSQLVHEGHSMEGAFLAYTNLDGINLVRHGHSEGYSLAYADLFHASLRQAHLFKVDLSHASLMKADCREANLHCANLEQTNLLGARFDEAKIENIHWGEPMYYESLGKKAFAERNRKQAVMYFEQAEEVSRNLRKVSERQGLFELAGYFFIKEMTHRRYQMPKFSWPRLVSKAVDTFCGYGEKPARVIMFSLVIIVLFALAYWVLGIADGGNGIGLQADLSIEQNLMNLGTSLYFSVVTFTTLGYGDLVPIGFSRLLAAMEAFTGSFTLALFVVVFVKKMTR
ncbi:ion channel [Pseudomonas sp. HK3]